MQKKLWIGLLIMALISPVGLILPEVFNSGDAWGEWGTDTLEKLLGFVPAGLKKYTGVWKAPVPDYNMGNEESSLTVQVVSYILSGVIGIVAVVIVIYFIQRVAIKK